MRITKAMGEAAKRELESGSQSSRRLTVLYGLWELGWTHRAEDRFNTRDWQRRGPQYQTALCLIMAIAGVKP